MNYQKEIDTASNNIKMKAGKKTTIQPTSTPSPIVSPNKPGWNRYMSKSLDYYIDYPETYGYGGESKNAISFEKRVSYPHRTSCWIFINDGLFSKAELDLLNQMNPGETMVIKKEGDTIPKEFNTYERLPDTFLGTKKAKSFVNRKVWEGDHMYLYIYERQGKVPYVFGGFTSEDKGSEDNISYSELKEVISTLRFLD